MKGGFDVEKDTPVLADLPTGFAQRGTCRYSIGFYDGGSLGAAITCNECSRPWLVGAERWRLKVTDDEQPETVPYCPGCATREFGDG